jgi:hypothetical protein
MRAGFCEPARHSVGAALPRGVGPRIRSHTHPAQSRWNDGVVESFPRYGVYLRPDPPTCAAVTTITTQLRAQYGFVSAAAFPPHATLAGNLPIIDLDRLIDNLSRELDGLAAFPVENAGLRRLGDSAVIYDISRRGEEMNLELRALAEAVHTVVAPLLTDAPGMRADTYRPDRWRAHLSLASHDLMGRPDLWDEIWEYVSGLRITPPMGFHAETVALYRLTSPSWTGEWWRQMSWTHVRSWHLYREASQR